MYVREMILALSFVALSFIVPNSQATPSLQELLNVTCTNERPKFCLPYGACCRISEFCDTRTGMCEPCLPMEVLKNSEQERTIWCRDKGQHNISLMRSESCPLACYDLFSIKDMIPLKETNFSIDNVTSFTEVKIDYSTSHHGRMSTAAIILSSAAVFLMLAIGTFLILSYIIKYRPKKSQSISSKESSAHPLIKESTTCKESSFVVDMSFKEQTDEDNLYTSQVTASTPMSNPVEKCLLEMKPSEEGIIDLSNKNNVRTNTLTPLVSQEIIDKAHIME
ncbi:uncharacterized protein LOC106064671 isoform X2 [Biomphalaria glabrata]|uniref:Uncharacterized protein LOC106064671 isoform X2 n=1 Tax=Biomphalaria glabrata TaxID=6526 RepID=A0A9W2YMK0_BIOGL|nr:uncharacterized protein LOC106064671 isoform X2 [Biomphalaria glabrata]